MADRRTDDSPLAPRRPLAGPGEGGTKNESTAKNDGAPKKESAPKKDAGPKKDGAERRPVAERVSERVSGAVASATESMRSATESRRPEERGARPSGTSSRPAPSGRQRTRKARLRMTHIDPWSVMKTAFLLSIAIGIVTVIAVAMVWSVLGAAGVWDSINKTVQEVIGGETGTAFDVEDYIGTSRVMGFTMIVAVVDVVLITALATLGAFLYNLAATLLGGLEVTLAEDER
ncbi:MAG TPA: DUF3566 domain-containing protein [Nocardioidaceae bacterium]|nr:DUF3566 domain-containing protein [Nocardioidaceae bacterium]